MTQAPTSRVPQNNNDAALLQARMNIRILAMKHAVKLTLAFSGDPDKIPSAVEAVAHAGIIEEYLCAGIFTPETPATINRKDN